MPRNHTAMTVLFFGAVENIAPHRRCAAPYVIIACQNGKGYSERIVIETIPVTWKYLSRHNLLHISVSESLTGRMAQ